VEGKYFIIVLYVDDLLLIGDDQLIKSSKQELGRDFEMKDMGLMHFFLVFVCVGYSPCFMNYAHHCLGFVAPLVLSVSGVGKLCGSSFPMIFISQW